ncbi:hypothetical protein [Maricaulis parjimensis]|uniref:hypothetical protein n=1 Tax=Maricaulis parjimensis TaxID=144023 RepID=UPI0019393F50|nr:hypothetical protein [Maricaulis parjimensis]
MAAALFTLRLVHTLIVILCVGMLIPLYHYALTGNGGLWAALAMVAPMAVLIGILLNKGTCILQTLACRMTGRTEGWERDVFFLPESWALKVIPVTVPVFTLGVFAALARWFWG